MPNMESAIKRVRQNVGKTERNSSKKNAARTAVKKFEAAAEENHEQAGEFFKEAVSEIDKLAAKGLIHQNKANRDKARLAKKLG